MSLEVDRAVKKEKQLQRFSIEWRDVCDHKVIITAGNKKFYCYFLLDQIKLRKTVYSRVHNEVYLFCTTHSDIS